MKTWMTLLAALSVTACQSDTKGLEKKIDELNRNILALNDRLGKMPAGGAAAQPGAQVARPEPEVAAPDATFAVAVKPDLEIGMVDGPATACVTIVEAWDFG